MPRRKRRGESLAAYFKKVFEENPQWLVSKSNADVIARYNADHSKGADGRVKANLANIKSVLRRKGGKGRKPGKAAADAAQPTNLEVLEVAIDDCLIMAANLDRRGLDKVIEHLRRARNLVVWKSGK